MMMARIIRLIIIPRPCSGAMAAMAGTVTTGRGTGIITNAAITGPDITGPAPAAVDPAAVDPGGDIKKFQVSGCLSP